MTNSKIHDRYNVGLLHKLKKQSSCYAKQK